MTASPAPISFSELTARLLSVREQDLRSTESDLLLRYTLVAVLLDKLLDRVPTPVRILEVGCNIHNLFPKLLHPRLAQVTRCDIQPHFSEDDFLLIPPQPPWPIDNESYDAVVALEVLEHMPGDARRGFIAECLRISRHGVILTAPNAHPRVVEADALVSDAFRKRNGHDHHFLREHQQFGLPSEAEIRTILRDLDCPHAVIDNAELDDWVAQVVLWENLKERHVPIEIQARLNGLRPRSISIPTSVSYRKIYVCTKTFDATSVLDFAGSTPSAPDDGSLAASVIQSLAAQMCDALTDQHSSHKAEILTLQNEIEKRQSAFRAQVALLFESHRGDIGALQHHLACVEGERADLRRRTLLYESFVHALFASPAWRLLQPMRFLRRLLRPRGFDAASLVPWQHIEPDPEGRPGHWTATDADPYFLVPCALPAGLLRVRLRMTVEYAGQMAFFADHGSRCDAAEVLGDTWVSGTVDREFLVRLPVAGLALRFDPIDVPGQFHIEKFEATPVSPLASRISAWRDRLFGRASYQKDSQSALGTQVHPRPDVPPSDLPTTIPARIAGQPLDIVYVLATSGLCGGVKVVMEHVSRLRARGHNVSVFCLRGDAHWFKRPIPLRTFGDPESLKKALARFRGIKVATWYETAPWVAESLQPGDRGYYLVQDIEDSYGNTPEEAAAAVRTYSLGLKPIAEGVWVRDQLKERFGLSSVFVSIGLDHEMFHPWPMTRNPNMILTQARTWSGGGPAGRRLKGWDTARSVIVRCRQLHSRTELMTFSMEARPSLPMNVPHIHHILPEDDHLARLYSRAGMYLQTSTHEGFGLPAAEAMACGCPVVATRAHGNEEFCIDGTTALLAPPGDAEALAQCCLRLLNEPSLGEELARNGRHLIQNYTWERVIDRLEQEFLWSPGEEIVINAPAAAPATKLVTVIDGEYPDLELKQSATIDWSIVIPTVNDSTLVAQCITSCRQFAGHDASLEFIVVDDGTRDPAVREELHRLSEELDFRLLLNHQNLGFSATVNHGMRHARGEFVMLCNNDIRFFEPWVDGMERTFNDPHLGVLGTRLLYPNGTIQHGGIHKAARELRFVHSYGLQPGDHAPAQANRYVWCVTGALFAIRREVLRQLGGFSTAYSTAYEDIDYCLHAWTHGIRVGYCGEVAAYHLEGGTRGATIEQKGSRPMLWAERERAGSLYFSRKWASLRYVESFEEVVPGGFPRPVAEEKAGQVLELVSQ